MAARPSDGLCDEVPDDDYLPIWRLEMTIRPCRPTVVALVGLAACAPLLADPQVFSVLDVARTRSVTAARLSPDAMTIAYLVSVPREPFEDDNGPPWSELHVVDTAGHSRPFVTGAVNVSRIAFRPDGHGISFVAKRGEDKHGCLYYLPLDGGEARKILEHDTDIGDYEWSPDGGRIAFLAKEKPPKEDEALEDAGFTQEVYEEQWRATRVWTAEPYYGDRHWGAADEQKPAHMLELSGSASALRWSPEGRRLAVALAPSSSIDDYYMYRRLYVVNADTSQITARLDNPGKLDDFRWSPNGQHLALISGEDIHDPAAGRLVVGSIADQTLHEVLPNYPGHVTAIAWQDAQTIMYLADQGVYSTLAEVRADGSEHKTILAPDRYCLESVSLSADGQAGAFIADSPQFPREVFFMKHGRTAPRRLTDTNPWLSERRLARQQVVDYQASDGEKVQGILMYPLDEPAQQQSPLVVIVHGGPESHYRNGWLTTYSRPGQALAAHNFAVFYPNYRGSTGRGVAYSKQHQSDYGGREFDDVIDGIDYLINIGLVDSNRVGVTGGSYGGFAAAWCATYHSERFAASVMFVGISDHISKFGTTDIPNEMYLVHARKWPWEDWDFFRRRSPLTYFQKCRTPLLILHGKDDTRIHPSQSMELYRYLKSYGQVPVRLVLYPGEGHGNRKAASRLDYSLRLLRWMEYYLATEPPKELPPVDLDYGPYKRDGAKADE